MSAKEVSFRGDYHGRNYGADISQHPDPYGSEGFPQEVTVPLERGTARNDEFGTSSVSSKGEPSSLVRHEVAAERWFGWMLKQMERIGEAGLTTGTVCVPSELGDLSLRSFIAAWTRFRDWCTNTGMDYTMTLIPRCAHGEGPWLKFENKNAPQ